MTILEQGNALLAHLCTTFACDTITFDSNNEALFDLSDGMGAAFHLVEEGDGALLACIVAGQPDPEDTELLYDLLGANYMWNATGGGTLGIDRNSGLLCIQRLIELPMDPLPFEDILAALVGAARYWNNRMNAAPAPSGLGAETFLRV